MNSRQRAPQLNEPRYNIEVLVELGVSHDGPIREWRKVHPTGGVPYVFSSYADAGITARKLYPQSQTRIVEAS